MSKYNKQVLSFMEKVNEDLLLIIEEGTGEYAEGALMASSIFQMYVKDMIENYEKQITQMRREQEEVVSLGGLKDNFQHHLYSSSLDL